MIFPARKRWKFLVLPKIRCFAFLWIPLIYKETPQCLGMTSEKILFLRVFRKSTKCFLPHVYNAGSNEHQSTLFTLHLLSVRFYFELFELWTYVWIEYILMEWLSYYKWWNAGKLWIYGNYVHTLVFANMMLYRRSSPLGWQQSRLMFVYVFPSTFSAFPFKWICSQTNFSSFICHRFSPLIHFLSMSYTYISQSKSGYFSFLLKEEDIAKWRKRINQTMQLHKSTTVWILISSIPTLGGKILFPIPLFYP